MSKTAKSLYQIADALQTAATTQTPMALGYAIEEQIRNIRALMESITGAAPTTISQLNDISLTMSRLPACPTDVAVGITIAGATATLRRIAETMDTAAA